MRQGRSFAIRAVSGAGLALVLLAGASRALTISGTVRNEAGTGLGNVDIDCIDLCSGDNIFLTGDKTAADGTYSVVVPAGTYDIHITPPAGSTVAAADFQDVVVAANLALGVTTLHPGRLVSGTVRTPALAAAAGVDLKFVDRATQHRVYLSKDVTTAAGTYAVRVPPGTYDIDFRPPATSAFADAERLGLVVGASDVAGLVDNLRTGFAITGTVRDKRNNKIKNVDIDVYDACTGERLATAHDNTDANGNYSVVVPAGTWTFNYDPPACVALESVRSPGTIVDRSRSFGTEQLKDAVAVSGIVHGPDGLPLADAKLKFYDVTAAGAPRQATTHDRTAADGSFSVLVPTGTYDVNVEPPAGQPILVGHLNSVAVGGPMSLGLVTLAAGQFVSGHVTAPGGAPVLNVNVNVVDALTRVSQRIAHDGTDAAGNFTIVLAPGTYDVEYDAPDCTGLAPGSQPSVTVAATTTLPAMPLVTGARIQGTVFDDSARVVSGVDLDFYPAGSATKIYTPNDQTAADGTFNLLVPPGSYDLKYVPSSLARLRPAEQPGLALFSSQFIAPPTLASGGFVSGTVRDASTFLPLAGVTIDVFPAGGNTPVWTPHHLTGALGTYAVVLVPGTWDLHYVPAPGSAYAGEWRYGVVVTGDLALADVALQPIALAAPAPAARPLALAAWPNPARGALRFGFSGAGPGSELGVWDVAGRRVATIWRGEASAPVSVAWNGRGDDGVRLAAGLYYARLVTPGGPGTTRRFVLLD